MTRFGDCGMSVLSKKVSHHQTQRPSETLTCSCSIEFCNFIKYSTNYITGQWSSSKQKNIIDTFIHSDTMANIAQQRIQREFREVVRSKEIAESGVQLELVNDDLTELAGMVAGPPDTPYSGGKYKLEIKIPDTYPFSPPKVTT